jgi:two-component system nitrogen regulation response regulator NtrX
VIAATNKDLEKEIEKGTFREDLFFRLSVIPVSVPPLRERTEDIPLLARHFADLFSRENNFRPKRFSAAAMEALQRYRWKGNIRELRNTIERVIIMTSNDVVDVPDLPEPLRSEARAVAVSAGDGGGNQEGVGTLREFKETAERNFLVQKLRENAWNISKTAEAIGTPRSNLYKKLEQYNIRQDTDA